MQKKGSPKNLLLLLVIVLFALPNHSLELKKKSFSATFFIYKKSLKLTNLQTKKLQIGTTQGFAICV